MVRFITTMDEYNALLETSKEKLVVIDFTASWCGPCKFIAPVFEKLSTENPDVEFVKVDVDEADEVSQACDIHAMPTFIFYKGGSKVNELKGANQDKLVQLIAQHK